MTALDEEFRCLAQRVDTFAKTVIHRDLQAQNIMVTKSRTPRIIDYQGARIGPTAYDIVSLLWDPYYRLDSELRGALLAYYLDRMAVKTGGLFDRDIFIKTIPHCRLQRHMQVLGAYGFLSTVKGKRYFLKHVDEGLRLLQEDAELTRDEYPVLYELVKKLS
jgi:aminoglycoside/choline kinase family phosphotransferase